MWDVRPLGLGLATVLLSVTAQGQTGGSFATPIEYTLVERDGRYALRDREGATVPIPRHWLFPPDEVEQEAEHYVSSFKYDHMAHAYRIGNGLMAVHLSSYDMQEAGSASASAGRDVFLVFQPQTRRLYPGGIMQGITKERFRSMGCFHATNHRFMIGDINRDGLADLGVIREAITCEEVWDEDQGVDTLAGPFYQESPLRWYVFGGDHWTLTPRFEGQTPPGVVQGLPLIGLKMTPVAFVIAVYERRGVRLPPRAPLPSAPGSGP